MSYKSLGSVVATLLITAAVSAAVNVTVNIKEWEGPSPNSGPHDPLAAAAGAPWYTGQRSNKLGRLDLKTGDVQGIRPENAGFRPARVDR